MTAIASADGGQEVKTGRNFLGQPVGLAVICLTEMWEQFSYYGMRALLIYYMTKQLLLGEEQASSIYGFYTAFAYFTPIVGGIAADRWLGRRRAVIIGGSIMAAGHFMMASELLFLPALATIALGNGLFLPSLPSQVNDLYEADDPRRSSAFGVFYVGINVGGFLAPLICGSLGELYGWHWGFGAAGVGMCLGLLFYTLGARHLPSGRRNRAAESEPDGDRGHARSRLLALAIVILAITILRSAYEQVGNTVALWIDTGVDRTAGSFSIPMTWFQSLNPLLVFVLTPLLLRRWRRIETDGKMEMTAVRMAWGAVIIGLSYSLLAAVTWVVGGEAHWLWLVLFFLVLTLGELFVLPTGLGLFARLAPPRLGATTVAAWFLATFAGSLAAGQVGRLWSRLDQPALFFALLALLAFVAGLVLLASARLVARAEAAPTGPVVRPQDHWSNRE